MMSAEPNSSGVLASGPEFAALRPEGASARGKARRRMAGAVGLVLLGGLLLLAVAPRGTMAPEPSSLPALGGLAPSAGNAVMPSAPTDSVLTMVIPAGAAADQQAGGRGYEMPAVISLQAGDTIVLRNDDDAPHMILYAFLMPGESHERTFTEPGSEVYSSGCGLHAAAILNFTTIFVGEGEKGPADASAAWETRHLGMQGEQS